jgi:hypothetical protein
MANASAEILKMRFGRRGYTQHRDHKGTEQKKRERRAEPTIFVTALSPGWRRIAAISLRPLKIQS